MKKLTMVKETKIKNNNGLFIIFCVIGLFCLILSSCSIHPETMSKEDIWMQARENVQKLSANQEPIEGAVTLYEATARAVKYNRDHHLKMMETALSMRQSELGAFDLLPKLTATAGYSGRPEAAASSSQSYTTGTQSLESSISQDEDLKKSDVTFTWNVLDFGLSYVRAKQKSSRYLMAKEVERKTVQNIVKDVRSAWWQALTAQRLLGQIDPLMTRVMEVLKTYQEIEKKRLDNPTKALNKQSSVLDILRNLENMRKELSQAKPKLASLMGLRHGQQFSIADPGYNAIVPELDWESDIMEKIALINRPELMKSRYNTAISNTQTKEALMQLFPNINLDAGWNWDSNSYLTDNTWFNYGTQMSWNLLNIFKTPATLNLTRTITELAKQRELAMSMTVLMQIHLAKAAYLQGMRSFNVEDLAFGVEKRILDQVKSGSKTKSKGELELIKQELKFLVASVRRDKAYAELENSFGRILVSMGINPFPKEVQDVSVAGLANAMENQMSAWQTKTLMENPQIDTYLPENINDAGVSNAAPIKTDDAPKDTTIRLLNIGKGAKIN